MVVVFLSPITSRRHVFNLYPPYRKLFLLLDDISNTLADTILVSQNIQTSYFNCVPCAQLEKTANGPLWKTSKKKGGREKISFRRVSNKTKNRVLSDLKLPLKMT